MPPQAPLANEGRLRLLQGMQDIDVRVTLVKDGGQRLSRENEIFLLTKTLDELGAYTNRC